MGTQRPWNIKGILQGHPDRKQQSWDWKASLHRHHDWPEALGGIGMRAHCYDKLILEEIFPGIESPTHEESTVMSDFHKRESVSEKQSSLLKSSFNWPSRKDQPRCQGSHARSGSLACLGVWKPTVSAAWLIRQRESRPLSGPEPVLCGCIPPGEP